ncbi:MAG: hypothetical protein AAFR35_15745 [Pseudomonadota bacterium]
MLTVLWMGLGLFLSASAFLVTQRQSALGARAEVEAARAVDLARSGLNVAMADLGRLTETGPKSPRDGRPTTIAMAEGQVTYRIFDEAGKIDINEAPVELIRPAMQAVGQRAGFDAFDASNIAEAIVANRGQQERTLYQILSDAGLGPRAAEIAMESFTAYNFSRQVNPRTAPVNVLAVIPGLGPGDVEDIISRRRLGQPMPRLGTASIWLAELEGPSFTIVSDATMAGGARARMVALVATEGLSFRGGLTRYEILNVRIER